ncbi:hypothetical protein B0H10DRAFT_1381138 [Mycena sp. CBHHK59/15]|nr:hypothetical protein B0H10DRAFT_1381138 [Mycena sp. CBHHK59/15]
MGKRKTQSDGQLIWPEDVETALLQGLELHKKYDKVADHVLTQTNIARTVKQIGSWVQTARLRRDPRLPAALKYRPYGSASGSRVSLASGHLDPSGDLAGDGAGSGREIHRIDGNGITFASAPIGQTSGNGHMATFPVSHDKRHGGASQSGEYIVHTLSDTRTPIFIIPGGADDTSADTDSVEIGSNWVVDAVGHPMWNAAGVTDAVGGQSAFGSTTWTMAGPPVSSFQGNVVGNARDADTPTGDDLSSTLPASDYEEVNSPQTQTPPASAAMTRWPDPLLPHSGPIPGSILYICTRRLIDCLFFDQSLLDK